MKFRLLSVLVVLAALMWLRAGLEYFRFQAALNLRLAAYQKIGQDSVREAICLLEEARARDPAQVDIAAELAALHLQTGRPKRARVVLDDAVRRVPQRPRLLATVYAQRGCFLLQAGDFEAARRDLRQALRWSPGDPGLRRLLNLAEGPTLGGPGVRPPAVSHPLQNI